MAAKNMDNSEKERLLEIALTTGNFEPLNEYYRKNPPELIFDDLGIFHQQEVPLPCKYKRTPCDCGIIHKWEKPETFELYNMHLLKRGEEMGQTPKVLKKCKECGEILLLERC